MRKRDKVPAWRRASSRGWIDEVKAVGCHQVAAALGVEVSRRGAAPFSCCDGQRRGRSDRRLPVGLRSDGQGWRCCRCSRSGDPLALVSRRIVGQPARALDAPGLQARREWSETQGW
mgnify:CR=1 FL=1